MNKGVVIFLLLFSMMFVPCYVNALSPQVLTQTSVTNSSEEHRNIFEELEYRLFEKEDKDFLDYVLLGIIIVGMLIVLVFLNSHTYTVRREEEIDEFLDDDSSIELTSEDLNDDYIDDDIEVVDDPEEIVELEEEYEDSEELPSDFLEDEEKE